MITMDDKHRLEDFGLSVEEGHDHPASPHFDRKTMHIPGMAGLWDFGTEIKEKPLNLPLATQGRDRMELQRKLNAFVAFLFDAHGKPRPIKIAYDYEPDKYYTVKVSDSFSPERVRPYARFVLPFVAADPYKYASANQYDPKNDTLYGEATKDDYYRNPHSFKWIYPRHYSGVNNYSSLNTDFIIEVSGTVTNPSVTNIVNNKKLTLPSITKGKLQIDGKRFVVLKDGKDILDGSNYNFFFIQPGEVGFLFEGDNPDATVTYRWLHKFN